MEYFMYAYWITYNITYNILVILSFGEPLQSQISQNPFATFESEGWKQK